MTGSRQPFDDMQRDAALVEGNITLHREGMAGSSEHGETRGILANADAPREEARVVARAALEDATHPGGRGGVPGEGQGQGRGEGHPRAGAGVGGVVCEEEGV